MAAVNAFGSKLQYHNGAIYVDVAQVTNISGPSVSRDSIETTHHTSSGGFREYIPGLKDAGEVSIDILWTNTDTTHAALYNQINGGQTGNGQYKIVFSDSAAFTFVGHVTGFEATAPIDDSLTASVTIKVSGKPTLA